MVWLPVYVSSHNIAVLSTYQPRTRAASSHMRHTHCCHIYNTDLSPLMHIPCCNPNSAGLSRTIDCYIPVSMIHTSLSVADDRLKRTIHSVTASLPYTFSTPMFYSPSDLSLLEGTSIPSKIGKDSAENIWREKIKVVVEVCRQVLG